VIPIPKTVVEVIHYGNLSFSTAIIFTNFASDLTDKSNFEDGRNPARNCFEKVGDDFWQTFHSKHKIY